MITSPMDDRAKAAWLCGLYAGLNIAAPDRYKLRAKLKPAISTAALVAFTGAAFNPLAVWEMLAVFDELIARSNSEPEATT